VNFRRSILFVLAMLLAAAPLLTCLPTPAMTDAEMACCKRMAGNCDMGAGNHSCCKTTMNAHQLALAISQNPRAQLSEAPVAVPILFTDAGADVAREAVLVTPFPIPTSPPGSQSILRI
jgi:hypothetical protein